MRRKALAFDPQLDEPGPNAQQLTRLGAADRRHADWSRSSRTLAQRHVKQPRVPSFALVGEPKIITSLAVDSPQGASRDSKIPFLQIAYTGGGFCPT